MRAPPAPIPAGGGGCEAGPFSVDLAAVYWTAHYPHHVAVAVIGAAVAVLMHRAAEFRDHENHGVLVARAERLGEAREPFAERLQMSRELPIGTALVDVRVPSAERHKRDPDSWVAADQMREAVGVVGKSLRRRRARIGLRHVLGELADQAFARFAAVAICAAD